MKILVLSLQSEYRDTQNAKFTARNTILPEHTKEGLVMKFVLVKAFMKWNQIVTLTICRVQRKMHYRDGVRLLNIDFCTAHYTPENPLVYAIRINECICIA